MDANTVTGRLVRTLHTCEVDNSVALYAVLDLAACVLVAEGVDPTAFAASLVHRVDEVRSIVLAKSSDVVAQSVAARFDES
jgi:hypothetical protein